MYQTILFDLDGTLTDSGQGILNSVAYALEKMRRTRYSQFKPIHRPATL
ncbi:phosphatase [Streptococcus suis]|nr:phosphatase [Streptococcus suis]